MDTLPVCEATVSADGPSKAPRGRPAKVEGVYAQEPSVEQDQPAKALDIQSLCGVDIATKENSGAFVLQHTRYDIPLKAVAFKSPGIRVPGAGGEQMHWVVAVEVPIPLTLAFHNEIQCVSVTRKGVTHYSPMTNVLFFEVI